MFKKVLLVVLGLLVVGGSTFFVLNGSDDYDASQYETKITNGLNIGSSLSFSLPDQFDKKHSLTKNTKMLIFSFAKDTGHTVKEFLEKESDDYLSSRDTFFVADLSPMPSIIRNMFAMPDLKKAPYSILLIYEEEVAAQFKDESKKDMITVVSLDDGVVTDVQYLLSAKELREALN